MLVEGGDEELVDWLRRYHEALEAFADGELDAVGAAFKSCAEERPEDHAVALYLEEIAGGERGGMLEMTGK